MKARKVYKSPFWIVQDIYVALLSRGCVARTISIRVNDGNFAYTGGSPEIEPLSLYYEVYLDLQEFLDKLQGGISYKHPLDE